ncbi:MAG: hypothetical protein AAF438_05680 [Pseudomonadota bacterium]
MRNDFLADNVRRQSIALMLGLVVALGGCATLTEQQKDERALKRFEFTEKFKAERKRCRARGGKIYVQAYASIGSDGIPRPGDRYFCR